MSSRSSQLDKRVYEQVYKQHLRPDDRRYVSSQSAALATQHRVPQPQSQFRENTDAKTVELQSVNLVAIPARTTSHLPAPSLSQPIAYSSLHHPKLVLPTKSPSSSDPWVDIFEHGDDVYASTLVSQSRAPTPSPMASQARPSKTKARLPAARHGPDLVTHRRDALSSSLQSFPEQGRGPISLDEHYALKSAAKYQRESEEQQRELQRRQRDYQQQQREQRDHRRRPEQQDQPERRRGRGSIDGRGTVTVPTTHLTIEQPIFSSQTVRGPTKPLHHTGRIAVPATGPSPHTPQGPTSQQTTRQEARPTHVRSSSDRAVPSASMSSAPRGHQVTSVSRVLRERYSSEMKPRASSRPRASLPGQWIVDARRPGDVIAVDLPRVGPPKSRERQDTAQPSVHDPAPSAQDDTALYPRRHHSPPPTRDAHRYRARRSSLDSQVLPRTRETDRDRGRLHHGDQQADNVRADRERDVERHRREHRPRYHTFDDDKSSMWLRESKFDPAALPPGEGPLTANILPPRRPQPSSRSSSHRTRPRAASESREVLRGVVTPSGAHARAPAQHRHLVPASQTVPPRLPHASAPAAAHSAPHNQPVLFAGHSRLKEDFDAKTLSPSVFSNDTPRPRSAPPEELPPPPKGFSVARKLRKRQPELPKLTLNAGPVPPGPVSPPLRSPDSVESRFGSVPRVFLPHRWLGR